jgi:hypothetical protein
LPTHAPDLLVVVRVAVGEDVEAGYFLRPQKARDRVLVLLAVARIDHGFEEALASQHRGVQAGRGSEPMIEVGSAISADALYIASSLALCPRLEIEGFALGRRVLHQSAVGLGQRRAGIAEAVDDGVAAVAVV